MNIGERRLARSRLNTFIWLLQVYDMARQSGRCQQRAQRVKGARLVPRNADVGAIRVSGSGWEGWILEGLQVQEPFNDHAQYRIHALRGACPVKIDPMRQDLLP